MSEEPVLRPEEVAGVLGAEEGAAENPPADGEPQPYSLREPVAIPASAEATARERLERVTESLAKRFDAESEAGIKIALEGFQQQRAAAALSVLPGPVWVTGLAAEGGGGLALALQPAVALALIERVFGGEGKPAEDGREPTSLEARVLSRLLGTVAEEIGAILESSLRPVELCVDAVPPRVASSAETVGVSPLRFTIGETDHASLLLAGASLLVPARVAGATTARQPGPLAARLERVGVSVRPVLPAGRVAMGDLAELKPGAVLEFGVAEDSAVELRVGENRIADGYVRRDGDRTVFKVESRVGQEPTEERS